MKWLFGFGAVLYMVACLGLYFVQEHIIFDAQPLDSQHAYRKGEEVRIPIEEDLSLSLFHFEVPQPRGVILYFHGNKGNIRRCIRQIESFAPEGYELYMPDYRGYGKSDGVITDEQSFLADAQKVYDYVKSQHPESTITLVGYSLGTGPASFLSAYNRPSEVILVAPYVSFHDLKNRWTRLIPDFLLKYSFDNKNHIALSQCPVTLVHGTADEVIPYDSSQQLMSLDPDRICLVTLPNEGHRGAIFAPEIREALHRF